LGLVGAVGIESNVYPQVTAFLARMELAFFDFPLQIVRREHHHMRMPVALTSMQEIETGTLIPSKPGRR